MNIKNTILYERLKAETPDWFRWIRKISITVAAVAVALLAANGVSGFELPQILYAPCQWITVAGITAATISSTAKK